MNEMHHRFDSTTLDDVIWKKIPVVNDLRGNLAFIQKPELGLEFKRVYYLFDIPSGATRGGHAHKQQSELIIALSGSFDIKLHDGRHQQTYTLNRPDRGLLIPNGIWRELENFSANAICLVLNTHYFDEADYIRDFDRFRELKKL